MSKHSKLELLRFWLKRQVSAHVYVKSPIGAGSETYLMIGLRNLKSSFSSEESCGVQVPAGLDGAHTGVEGGHLLELVLQKAQGLPLIATASLPGVLLSPQLVQLHLHAQVAVHVRTLYAHNIVSQTFLNK